MEAVTSRDVLPDIAHRSDTVVQLRHWGRDEAFALPTATAAPITIGSAPACTWRLADANSYVSRLHAELVHQAGRWTLRDRGSKNGLRFDGLPRPEMVLEPGAEVGLGSLLLVAESPRTIALRSYLRLLLGWDASAVVTADLALRSIRLASACRAALVLRGEDDLVACAREIHRFVRGDDTPFIVCDPRRLGAPSVRAPASYVSALSALQFAGCGSLCVLARRVPRDFAAAAAALHAPDVRVLMIVCGTSPATNELTSTMITIPSLASRAGDLDRIVDECDAAAAADLGVAATLSDADRDWIRDRCARSIGEIARSTRRLLAVRATGTVSGAAALLGMTHAALGQWFAHRRLKD